MGRHWAKNGHPVEFFFVSEESRDFFQLSHTTTYSGPKKIWGGGTVVHWAAIAKNGQKIGQKWALDSLENFFVSAETRDFFQPSHTTTYRGPKSAGGTVVRWAETAIHS
jgi:hypothetical protein